MFKSGKTSFQVDFDAEASKDYILTLEAPVILHNLKAPMAVKLTAVWFIAF